MDGGGRTARQTPATRSAPPVIIDPASPAPSGLSCVLLRSLLVLLLLLLLTLQLFGDHRLPVHLLPASFAAPRRRPGLPTNTSVGDAKDDVEARTLRIF